MSSKLRVISALAALLGATVLALGIYGATGPARTLHRFGDAIAARDSAEISSCVDFPSLRESIKQQLSRSVERRSKSLFADNPIAALASGLASSMSDALLESLVTPAGLEKLLAGEQMFSALENAAPNAASQRATQLPEAISKASYSFVSLSEFSVTIKPKPDAKVVLLLKRQGLDWKISEVKLHE